MFSRLGAGFDIVSGGELARVLAAGGSAAKTVFSGAGKTEAEMRAAEVMVDGAAAHLVRGREPLESLFALERILP